MRTALRTFAKSKVLVLGGYGNFGGMITKQLVKRDVVVIMAGRSPLVAEKFIQENLSGVLNVKFANLDSKKESFVRDLAVISPNIVVNAVGPYDDMNYSIIKACLEIGADYVDLADNRSFVVNSFSLDAVAREKGRVIVVGASTVPGVSSAVLDKFLPEFDQLTKVEYDISPGNQTMFRGLATFESVLSYCGKPLKIWKDGSWKTVTGWMGMRGTRMLGTPNLRYVSYCDIPDSDLFPQRYKNLETCEFRAGTELKTLQASSWILALLGKVGLVKNWSIHSGKLMKLWLMFFKPFGTPEGGMNVRMTGRKDNQILQIDWRLFAGSAHGPNIPITPALIVIDKIIAGEIETGAYPCMGLFEPSLLLDYLKDYDIYAAESKNLTDHPIASHIGLEYFKSMSKEIQEFHTWGGKCTGYFKVTRGRGLFSNFISSIIGLPKSNPNAYVVVVAKGQKWTRHFEGSPRLLESQWCEDHNGLIIEDFGFAKFGFQLLPLKDGKGFKHVTKKFWILGLPIHRLIAPTANGITIQDETGWKAHVEVKIPFLGLKLVEYSGSVKITPQNTDGSLCSTN